MSTLRESLEAARDKLSAEPAEPEVLSETAPSDPQAGGAPDVEAPKSHGKDLETTGQEQSATHRARDKSGKFAKEAVAKSAPKAVRAMVADSTPQSESDPSTIPAAKLKAPVSWKPTVREKWEALPPEVQEEVLRRESETTTSLSQAVENKRFRESFREAVAPYEGMLRAEGLEPMAAVGTLLQTAMALRTAPPGHKAQMLSNMARTFQVPVTDMVVDLVRSGAVSIEALDSALAGQPMNGGASHGGQTFDPNQFAQQVERSIMQRLTGQRDEHLKTQSAKQIEEFSQGKEFLEDVRQDMADIVEMASRRGVALTLEQAYERACRMHPEVSKVMSQRDAAKVAKARQEELQRSKLATSSVRSEPSGGGGAGGARTLRDTLMGAVARHSRG